VARASRHSACCCSTHFNQEHDGISVRAKFTYTGDSRSVINTFPHKKEDGQIGHSRPEPTELRLLKFSPVYANNDPKHENSNFWQHSPTGSIELGTVNKAAWEQFELGKEYYVDFTRAGA
jgi:hypothetical protein